MKTAIAGFRLIWRVIAAVIICRAGLIAQPAHEPHQLHGHCNGLLTETNDKPFAYFVAECCAMNVIDLDVSSVRGRDHEISDLQNEVAGRGREYSAASCHKTNIQDARLRTRLSQAGSSEIRPDLF